MSINSDFIVTAFIKEARNYFLNTYLIKRGDASSGEIFLKLNKLNGFSKIYTYKKTKQIDPWEFYSSDNWEEDDLIKRKLEKILDIDPDIWILELEDKEGNCPNFRMSKDIKNC